MKTLNVAGARPNFMKIAPIIRKMREFDDWEPLLVHTGQHYDRGMSDVFFNDLGIPAPDLHLGVNSGTHAEQTAGVMVGFEKVCLEEEPDLVLVVGDVNSTLAATIVATKLHIPVAHVEAGLRSFDRTMPEEVNRVMTDAVSDLLFTTSRDAGENLRLEGIPGDKIHFVGNVMIDTLLGHVERARDLDLSSRLDLEPGSYALVTLHRPSNVDDPAVLSGLFDVLRQTARSMPVLFPIHPRTAKNVAGFGIDTGGIRLIEPVGYLEFLHLTAGARVVLTDSGGLQEETTILGIPCLTLRTTTERPVTVTAGTNQVVGCDPARIRGALDRVLSGEARSRGVPELWDGRAAERIVDVIRIKFRLPISRMEAARA